MNITVNFILLSTLILMEGLLVQTVYQTHINKIGSSVSEFLEEKMFILFGDNAPVELSDYCLLINVNEIKGVIEKGNFLVLDDKEFAITSVGGMVKKNLGSLGHITLKFDGAVTPELPGTLHLECADLHVPPAGSILKILKK